jgi:hypothetical protein
MAFVSQFIFNIPASALHYLPAYSDGTPYYFSLSNASSMPVLLFFVISGEIQ